MEASMAVTIMRGVWGSSSEAIELVPPPGGSSPISSGFSSLTSTSTSWRYTLRTALLSFPIANGNKAPDLRGAVTSTCRCQVRVPGCVDRAWRRWSRRIVAEGPASGGVLGDGVLGLGRMSSACVPAGMGTGTTSSGDASRSWSVGFMDVKSKA